MPLAASVFRLVALGTLLAAGAAHSATFPSVVIRKAEAVHEWPFSLDEGSLVCVALGGTRAVLFMEELPPEQLGMIGNMTLPRSVVVSSNPFALFASIEDRALYAPFDGLETLIRRLAPYERKGMALCEAAAQPSR